MTVLIENEQLRALISEHGAELTSLVEKNGSREYLWNRSEERRVGKEC